uniref:Uncharacterized protein n=1 Tax=Avena sativa TaxID=4498 RepID=A0ACD5TWZ4_AVESA
MKMLCLERKRRPVVQAAPDHQQQALMGHQMQPLNAVLPNSSAAPMSWTASTIPLTVRPPQVNQVLPSFAAPVAQVAQLQWHHAPPNTTSTTPVAPVVQLHPCHPTVVTQIQTERPARQPQPKLTRMNQQQQDLRQSFHAHRGQQSSVATMQTGHPDRQNSQQSAGEVDWREDIFQKITSLKDAHLSELVEFEQAMRARVPQGKTNEQLEELPKEQVDQYKKAVNMMARIRCALSFLQIQKSNIPELVKDQFGKCQTALYSLLQFYRESKVHNGGNSVRLESQNYHEQPRVVNITGATDNSLQKHEEQPAAEAFPQSSENVLSGSPLAQQQNYSNHLASEAENVEVCHEAEAPVAVTLSSVTGDTEPFTGGACNQQIQQENPTDEAIPQLKQNVDPAGTSPAELEAEAEAETPVPVEAATTSALRSLASDMGTNLKRAFCHTMSGTMDGSSCVWSDDESSGESCYKRRKAQDGSLLDEIRAACSMLIGTNISISKDDTGDVSGTVIELCYNAVSLAPDLRAVIGASDIKTKLLAPDDYPWSSPVVHVSNGGPRSGLPGAVEVAFRHALGLLPEPRSIKRITEVWDSVARRVVSQFAYRLCGGTFDTRSEDYVYMLLSKFNRQVEELSCT